MRCPRCGVALEDVYKFCPNCAYRLRPELGRPAPPLEARATLGQRLLSLGGYLAFASLLLLLAFVALHLFVDRAAPQETEMERVPFTLRDEGTIPLGLASFVRVEPGQSYFGAYDEEAVRTDPAWIPEPFFIDYPFRIAVHEVTNDQFYRFLTDRAARGAPALDEYPTGWDRRTGRAGVPRMYAAGRGNDPVTGVDFALALEFCAWLWEEFGADPELIVDLPTAHEWVRAGRRDHIDWNFPWGPSLTPESRRRLLAPVRPVTEVEKDQGIAGLVGNVAEWVHGDDGRARAAAVFSWDLVRLSPFSDAGFGPHRVAGSPDVGFRCVLRRAEALPSFVAVEPGDVNLRVPEWPILHETDGTDEPSLEPLRLDRPPPVERPFEIARAEITNRQYLEFLNSLAGTREEQALTPPNWRANPLRDAVFTGPFRTDRAPWAGEESRPVQGVLPDQAAAYAAWLEKRLRKTCRLPTISEHLRAARGDSLSPYPWGDDGNDARLVCAGRRDDWQRSADLLGRLGDAAPPLLGLAGNLPEIVRAPDGEGWLLAGGCYELPSEYCTLDAFVPYDKEGWWHDPEQADETAPPKYILLHPYAGFRVVRTEPW